MWLRLKLKQQKSFSQCGTINRNERCYLELFLSVSGIHSKFNKIQNVCFIFIDFVWKCMLFMDEVCV